MFWTIPSKGSILSVVYFNIIALSWHCLFLAFSCSFKYLIFLFLCVFLMCGVLKEMFFFFFPQGFIFLSFFSLFFGVFFVCFLGHTSNLHSTGGSVLVCLELWLYQASHSLLWGLEMWWACFVCHQTEGSNLILPCSV